MDGDDRVVGQHAPAARLDPSGHRPYRLPHVDVAVGDAEHARDARVEQRLLAQRLRRIDLLAVDAGVGAPLGEPSAYAGSSNGVVTKNPPMSSIESGEIF